MPPVAAVIFDMDGLALDTEPAYACAWKQAASSFGVALSDEFCASLMGKTAEDVQIELQRAMGDGFDLTRFYPLAEKHWREHIRNFRISRMPGLVRLVALLRERRIPYALATNSRRIYALECLHFAEAEDLFSLIVCRDDVAKGKPAPDLVLEAASRLGVTPDRCWVLEDSEAGLMAAVQARAVPVLVNRGPEAERLKHLASAHLDTLEQVASLLDGQDFATATA